MSKETVMETVKKLDYRLVVAEPFGDYQRGSTITESDEIKRVLESDNAGHVRKVKGE